MGLHYYYKGQDTSSGLSAGVWGDCPGREELLLGPRSGYELYDDFVALGTANPYTITNATNGTFVLTDYVGGAAIADSADATENRGVQVQSGQTAGEFVLPAAGKPIWFEARVAAVTSLGDIFVGLTTTDTTIVATHAMSTTNYIGFKCMTGDRVILGVSADATGEDTCSINGGTALTLSTYYKLGFKVDGLNTVTFYLNGVPYADTIPTAYIPATEMRLSLVSQNYTTTRSYLHIDWWRVVQLR